MLTLTERAVNQLHQMLDQCSTEGERGLRLDIEKGGCAGYQYVMKVAGREGDDLVVTSGGVSVFVARGAESMLSGCVLDYVDALNDSGFRIENPNAERSCGCGTSFEPRK